jgi:hypothetical protein
MRRTCVTEEEQLISDTMVKMLDFTIEMLQQAQEQLKVGDMAGSIQCTMMAAAFLQELLSPAEGDPQPSQAAYQSGEQAVVNAVEYGKGMLRGFQKTLEGL